MGKRTLKLKSVESKILRMAQIGTESVPVKNGGKGGNAKLMSLQKNKVLCLEDDIRVGKSETPPVQLNEGGVTTDVDSSSLVEHKD
ncbi:hypothetical protein X801_08469, partial [Opisthorchis viverrini]